MDVTAFTIGKHLTDLVGRHVVVKVVESGTFAPETRFACYDVEPTAGTAVVQMDLHLLASLAGIMIGFPAGEIDSQIRSGKLDENLTDASQELMNVLSSVIVSQGRAVFKGLFSRAADYNAHAQLLLGKNYFPLKLSVTPVGGKAGLMMIAADR